MLVNGGNCRWPDINWTIHLHTGYKPSVSGSFSRRLKAEIEFRQAAIAERRALACAKVVITASTATRRELIDDFGLAENTVHVVYLGVDPSTYRIPSEEERAAACAALGVSSERARVVFAGAIGDRRKGFDTVYAAWRYSRTRTGASSLSSGCRL